MFFFAAKIRSTSKSRSQHKETVNGTKARKIFRSNVGGDSTNRRICSFDPSNGSVGKYKRTIPGDILVTFHVRSGSAKQKLRTGNPEIEEAITISGDGN